ncbi:MAG: toxin Bro [Lachnospiraceae bacterium]|nr:toxin Bro [Lachnospiraceae bacterium]
MAGPELQTPIEIALGVDENGMTTAKKLFDFLGMSRNNYARWYKANIADNQFAEENVDYFPFLTNEECGGQASLDGKLTAHFAKKLSMKGNGERAEQAREYFTRLDEKMKEIAINRSQLSPLLQLLISMELKQKEQEQRIQALESGNSSRQQELAPKKTRNDLTDAERESRRWVLRAIGKIAEGPFFNELYNRYQLVYRESYDRLEQEADCDLAELVAEAKERAKEQGVSKVKIKKITRQSVIAGDAELRFKYASVVKDMMLMYCADGEDFF